MYNWDAREDSDLRNAARVDSSQAAYKLTSDFKSDCVWRSCTDMFLCEIFEIIACCYVSLCHYLSVFILMFIVK